MDKGVWDASPLSIAVRSITNGPDVPFRSRLRATLHTEKQDYPLYKLLTRDRVRDYVKMMMDNTVVSVTVPLGDYIYLIYPNKDHMELTISKLPMRSTGDRDNQDEPIEETRYKCIFDPKNPSYSSKEVSSYDQRSLNNVDLVTFQLRLVDRNVELLRNKVVQGIFRWIPAKDLIKSLLLGESQKVLVDGSPCIGGIDMVEPDNQEPISQVVLNSGSFLCSIPTLIQEKCDGMYKYGVGTYYQRYLDNTPMWFVYPLFDFDRYDNGEERTVAIFYAAPTKFYKGVERTYRQKGGVVEIVVTTDKVESSISDIHQLNRGVGFRLTDQNAFMKKPAKMDTDGTVLAARGNLNREVGFVERRDGVNFVPTIHDKDTNAFHETSKIAERQASFLTFGWENSNASLLYPGMPAKFCFLQGEDIVELKCTILGVHIAEIREGNVAEPDRYSERCVITVATEISTRLPEFDEEDAFVQTTT